MTSKRQEIFFAASDTFDNMCKAIFAQANKEERILKITIFNAPADNNEYTRNLQLMKQAAKDYFGDEAPLTAYVAQPCVTAALAAEVTYMPHGVTIERHTGYTLLQGEGFCELVTEGLTGCCPDSSIRQQSEEIFANLDAMLTRHGFSINDIYRQWNYIEQITSMHDERQNYQEFNDARSRYYNSVDWNNGYPAATGIGTNCGGVMIEAYAIKVADAASNQAIDNPIQISAHNYSQKVLTGKSDEAQRTTPKFERARIVGSTVYISGTAAIKGEDSLALDNAVAQTAETMNIIKCLTSPANVPTECSATEYTLLRTYIKNNHEAQGVIKFMEENYPDTPKHYLIADVCRPELLIEIEGTAVVK